MYTTTEDPPPVSFTEAVAGLIPFALLLGILGVFIALPVMALLGLGGC